MERFGYRFAFVDVYQGEVKRVLIAADKHAEDILVVAEPDGPDGVFIIRCEECAIKSDVNLMMQALDNWKIPYIQNHF